jgi:hypothetical protein
VYIYTNNKLLREGPSATSTTLYEKKMSKDSMSNVIPTQVAKMRTISKATLRTNMKLVECMETPLMTFGDANNIALALGQGDQELNNPSTFVDKKEFNVRPETRGKVAFVQLLTSEGY